MLYLLRSRCGNAFAVAGLLACLQACVVVPRTTEVYDPDCGIMTRQMDLEAT